MFSFHMILTSDKKYRFLENYDLLAIQVSTGKIDVLSLSSKKPLYQCSGNNGAEILE